jgi:hypothetical protein
MIFASRFTIKPVKREGLNQSTPAPFPAHDFLDEKT